MKYIFVWLLLPFISCHLECKERAILRSSTASREDIKITKTAFLMDEEKDTVVSLLPENLKIEGGEKADAASSDHSETINEIFADFFGYQKRVKRGAKFWSKPVKKELVDETNSFVKALNGDGTGEGIDAFKNGLNGMHPRLPPNKIRGDYGTIVKLAIGTGSVSLGVGITAYLVTKIATQNSVEKIMQQKIGENMAVTAVGDTLTPISEEKCEILRNLLFERNIHKFLLLSKHLKSCDIVDFEVENIVVDFETHEITLSLKTYTSSADDYLCVEEDFGTFDGKSYIFKNDLKTVNGSVINDCKTNYYGAKICVEQDSSSNISNKIKVSKCFHRKSQNHLIIVSDAKIVIFRVGIPKMCNKDSDFHVTRIHSWDGLPDDFKEHFQNNPTHDNFPPSRQCMPENCLKKVECKKNVKVEDCVEINQWVADFTKIENNETLLEVKCCQYSDEVNATFLRYDNFTNLNVSVYDVVNENQRAFEMSYINNITVGGSSENGTIYIASVYHFQCMTPEEKKAIKDAEEKSWTMGLASYFMDIAKRVQQSVAKTISIGEDGNITYSRDIFNGYKFMNVSSKAYETSSELPSNDPLFNETVSLLSL